MLSTIGITELLIDWSAGKDDALEKLFPLVEKELHRLAHNYMRKLQPGNTLQTTAVINETYIRLIDQNKVQWQNRAHFFGIAANMMRRFLLNYIRDRKAKKRGDGAIEVSLADSMLVTEQKSHEILALEEALCMLAEIDERKAKVVELRYYGGLNADEIAEVLKVSVVTVRRDWTMAKAWLAREVRK
ncbi:MAG TPA: ECF-type sigma factor [Pyrinomonadaceae bacterium]|jgi:RNA polymerase sigma factor (TIGR02999 family)